MRHSSGSGMLSQPLHPWELLQQGCTMVPREQLLQLQQQLLQAEQRSQRLQEELESRPSETNMQQVRLLFLGRLLLQWGVGFAWCFDFWDPFSVYASSKTEISCIKALHKTDLYSACADWAMVWFWSPVHLHGSLHHISCGFSPCDQCTVSVWSWLFIFPNIHVWNLCSGKYTLHRHAGIRYKAWVQAFAATWGSATWDLAELNTNK